MFTLCQNGSLQWLDPAYHCRATLCEGTPGRKQQQKSCVLTTAQGESLSGVSGWKEICVFAWKLIFRIVKHPTLLGACLSSNPVFLLFDEPGNVFSEGNCTVPTLRGTPLSCFPSQNKDWKHKDLDSWPVSGKQLFLFQVVTTSSSTKWDVFNFLTSQTIYESRFVWNAFLVKARSLTKRNEIWISSTVDLLFTSHL